MQVNSSYLPIIKPIIFSATVQFYRQCNIHVIPWTINDPVEKRYFEEVLKLPIYMTDSLKVKKA